MSKPLYYLVDVTGPDLIAVAGPDGELFAYADPATRYSTREDAERAAERCRLLHPDLTIEVHGKSY